MKKWDEAIQTCIELINLKARRNSSNDIPTLEEKVIRAIMGGSLHNFRDARASSDKIALDSSKRTLTRLRDLLDQFKSSTKAELWLYEISASFNEEMGLMEDVLDDLMKEYRTLQSVKRWENDTESISKMTNLMKEIYAYHKASGVKEGLVKCKFLINGVSKKLCRANCDSNMPMEVAELNGLLLEIENIISDTN